MFDCFCSALSFIGSFFFLEKAMVFFRNEYLFQFLFLLFFCVLYWLGFSVFYVNQYKHTKKDISVPLSIGIIINIFFFFLVPILIDNIQKIDKDYFPQLGINDLHKYILLSYAVFLVLSCIFELVKGLRKKRKITEHSLYYIVSILFIFSLYVLWITACISSFCGILNDKNSSYDLNSGLIPRFSIDSLYSCYTAVFIGAITLYFTVFAFIKPKRISLSKYIKIVLGSTEKVLYCSLLVVFVINTLLVFYNINNTFYRIAIVDSIFLVIILTIKGICDFRYLENEKNASEFYIKKICSSCMSNEKEDSKLALLIFEDYLLPCFGEDSLRIAYDDYETLIKTYYGSLENQKKAKLMLDFAKTSVEVFKSYGKTYITHSSEQYKKCKQIIYVMDMIAKNNLKFILKNYQTENKDYFDEIIATAYSLYEIWFDFYKKIIFEGTKDIKYSMLLKGAEPLKFGILLMEKEGKKLSNEYEKLYKNYIRNAYDLCVIVLHQCDFLTFRNFLQDYIYSIQFLSLHPSCREIVKLQNYHLVLIATFIANLYQENRIEKEYLKLLKNLFCEIEYIQIGGDAVLYTEPLSISGIHEITKDSEYYFILSLIYAISFLKKIDDKQNFVNEIISKMKKSNNEDYIFESLFLTLESMPDIDVCNQEDVFIIKETLRIQRDCHKQKQYEDLKKAVNKNIPLKLPELIEKDIKEYEKHFSYCSVILDGNVDENFKQISLPTGFCFSHSGNYIAEVSSFDVFGIFDHFRFIDTFIFNQYLHYASVKNISSLDEIFDDYQTEERIEILASLKYHSYFYTLKDIKYEGEDILFKNHRLSVTFDRDISDYLIIKNDLKEHIYMSPLEIKDKTKGQLKEDKENILITVSVEYQPEFYIRVSSNIKVYSIIGVQEEV